MVLKVKHIFFVILMGTLAFFGWKSYQFFFDTETPQLHISGVANNGFYCGNLQCSVSGNKTGHISIMLNKKPLTKNFKVRLYNQEYPFAIPTHTIANGKHKLQVIFEDSTYHKNKSEQIIDFYVDNTPLQAAFIKPENEFKVFQGRTLHLQFQVNKKIKSAKVSALSKTYECFPEAPNSSVYETFIPITCEESPNEYLLSLEIEDQVGTNLKLDNKFQIVQFPFKKQVLRVSSDKIKKEKEVGKSPEEFEKDLQVACAKSPKKKLWRGAFCAPIEIAKTTCDFGTVRVSQEKGKYSHKAVDIINTPKSVVWASQDGIVRIKERYAFSGNTVIVDHGWGIITMYFHLDDFANIQVGDLIRKGNPVGTLGQTGYASGYHLHWELRVKDIAVDPMQWIKSTF